MLRPYEPSPTLNPDRRLANLTRVYTDTIPDLLAADAGTADAFLAVHRQAMAGSTALNLEGIAGNNLSIDPGQISLAGLIRSREMSAALGGYEVTMTGWSTTDPATAFFLHVPAPDDAAASYLLRKVGNKADQLAASVGDATDAAKLSIWGSQMIALAHPAYDGNGRGTRGVYTYTMARLTDTLPRIEKLSDTQTERSSAVLNDVGLNLLLRLYNKHPEYFPDYIPPTQLEIPAQDILGIPAGVTLEQATADKRRSIGGMLSLHALSATLPDIRTLILDTDVQKYQTITYSS